VGRRKERAYGDGRVFRPKGSRKWMVAWYVNGKEVRRSTHTESEAEAHDYLRKMLGDKVDGRPVPVRRRCTFEDLVALLRDDYRVKGNVSWDTADRAVGHLREAFGQDQVANITADRVVKYQAARLDEGAARATIHKELAALKRMFRLALRHGRIHQAPYIESPTPDNARQGYFTEEEVRLVAGHLPEDVRPLWLFLYHTGWRPMDVVGRREGGEPLRWSQVDFEAGTVRREGSETKNKTGKVFPLVRGSEPEAVLLAQRGRTTALERATGRIIPWVFHRNGSPVRSYYEPVKKALQEVGLPDRIPYDVKRTAARRFDRGGLSQARAMRAMGLQTPSVYRRYNITTDEDAREGLARMYEVEAERNRKEAQR
jgi:integrase